MWLGLDHSGPPDHPPTDRASSAAAKPRLDAPVVKDVFLIANQNASPFGARHLFETDWAILTNSNVRVRRGGTYTTATTPPVPVTMARTSLVFLLEHTIHGRDHRCRRGSGSMTPLPTTRTMTPLPTTRTRTDLVQALLFIHGRGQLQRYGRIVPDTLDVLVYPRLLIDFHHPRSVRVVHVVGKSSRAFRRPILGVGGNCLWQIPWIFGHTIIIYIQNTHM